MEMNHDAWVLGLHGTDGRSSRGRCVCDYPPYHSKYNPAERPWAVLDNAWNGDLLDTIDAAVGHARSMTWKGEHPPVIEWFDKTYEKGKKLGKKAMMEIADRLERLAGLPKWFVDIAPVPPWMAAAQDPTR